ncbi:MAG: GGDEF domain-containing protein [Deltaproteobacteria bacterium]|nr:GGDEF domain-containing protein [Deltaproteobacteria bacterium]
MSSSLTMLASVLGIVVTGVIDYATGTEIRLFPLYFLPVALVAWNLTRAAAIAAAFLSALAWVVSNSLAGRVYSSPLVWPVNFTSQFLAFGVVAGLVAEVRRRLRAEQDLSRRDGLTGLPNSRAFYERGELLIAVARRSGRPVTLAYLDLDDFKRINDERGHQEGDRALAETAGALRQTLRASDLVARLGGDEFAMLLPDTGPDAAASSLERVREIVASCMRRNSWPATVSVGGAVYLRAPRALEEAIEQADSLMYRAKKAGKDRVHLERVEPRDDPTSSAGPGGAHPSGVAAP